MSGEEEPCAGEDEHIPCDGKDPSECMFMRISSKAPRAVHMSFQALGTPHCSASYESAPHCFWPQLDCVLCFTTSERLRCQHWLLLTVHLNNPK